MAMFAGKPTTVFQMLAQSSYIVLGSEYFPEAAATETIAGVVNFLAYRNRWNQSSPYIKTWQRQWISAYSDNEVPIVFQAPTLYDAVFFQNFFL